MRKEEIQDDVIDRLSFFFQGNQWAVQLCLDLFFVVHLWDDLIDKDKNRFPNDINEAFSTALISIPANPFYLAHIDIIRPILLNVILKWHDSNVLDHGSLSDKRLSFVHRAGICEMFNICAYLIGGMEWAQKHGPEMRRLYQEDFETFVQEMEGGKDA